VSFTLLPLFGLIFLHWILTRLLGNLRAAIAALEASKTMNSLTLRIISAIVAIAVVALLYFFFGAHGLRFLCYMAPILGVRELSRILFKPTDAFAIKVLFAVFVVLIYLMTISSYSLSIVGFAVVSILFCCVSILFEGKFEDLTALSLFQAKGILGFFYVGLLPALATRMLDLPHGQIWFVSMLAIVFAGDTMAYVTGLLWGNKKLLPNISPKKTIIGSAGGLVGSALAGAVAGYYFLSHIPLFSLVFLAVFTGLVAQLGDLFESMLKRVANRKDSGTIMPGHGGILDRLDGVLFGAPIMLAGAMILEGLI
jgi:phosphatidate cytidylyltransferase